MDNCKVSVAIASYNGEAYIKEQLDSIYTQTQLPEEIIVCDDGSCDHTIDILNDYKKRYGLKFFVNDEKLGFVRNFEKTISLCSGDYIVLSDQDDVWLPDKIKSLYKAMINAEKQHPDSPVLIHHDVFIADENLNNSGKLFIGNKGRIPGLKNILFGNPKVQGASVIMNRKLKELCFPLPEGVPLHDLYISFVAECLGVRKFIPEPLSLYRQHANNQIGINSFSVSDRVRNYFRKQVVLADDSEKNTLLIFKNKFNEKLSKSDKDLINDYFMIVGNEINNTARIFKVVKNRFNNNGSVFKLIMKIANSNSNSVK